MNYSYTTDDIESFYMLIGILVTCGYELDFEYMRYYKSNNKDSYLIVIKGD